MLSTASLSRRDLLRHTAAWSAAGLLGASLSPATAAADSAGAWQIGCYTRPWAQYEWPVALDAIAAAGYRHIGLMTIAGNKSKLVLSVTSTLEEAAKIRDDVQRRGMQIPSVYGGGFPMKTVEEGIEGLRHLIDVCAMAGSKTLLLGGCAEKAADIYYKVVAECCAYAAEKKLGLTLKPHGGANSTGPELRKIIERVGKKNFTIWYDAGNIFYYSQGALNPIDDAPSVAGLVSGWCIKDFKAPKDVAVTPGTGLVDFRTVLAKLKQGGFTGGPLVVETLTPGTPPGNLPELLAQAKQARAFLEKLVAA